MVANIHKISSARVDEVIGTVGLTPEKSKKISQLSKGYKQRVGLAQAIINQPELLILDEPTNGLDHNQILEIRNVIKEKDGKSWMEVDTWKPSQTQTQQVQNNEPDESPF